MAAGKKRETFSNVDAAWLRMDTPTNMAMITGVFFFDQPLDFKRLQVTIERRFLTIPRFRMRVKRPAVGLPRWEMDPHFNLSAHLHRIALPYPADDAALEELTGDLMSTPLDFSKPLWQMHYVENYSQGSAMIIRMHHCIADGIALMQVLLQMTDTEPDAPWPEPPAEESYRWDPLAPLRPALKLVGRTWRLTEMVVHESTETLFHPTRMIDIARLGTKGTLALGKLLLLPPDRKTIFKGNCGVAKRTAWSRPISLKEVKAVGKAMGGTVNDVLLSTVTGALRRYMESRGESTEYINIRTVVPVNLRPPKDEGKLGNRFGLVFLSLPVLVREPITRLRVLKRRMDAIKNSAEAVVAFGILQATGMSPQQIENIIISIFGAKATAVMTNVPGPQQTLYYAGAPITRLMFWVPSPAGLGMGVSIMSYNGEVILGVATDACLVPDPDMIIEGFHTEFEQLKEWVLTNRLEEPKTYQAARLKSGDNRASGERPQPAVEETEAALQAARLIGLCQAVTRAGKPCKRRALPGSTTCSVHSNHPALEKEKVAAAS